MRVPVRSLALGLGGVAVTAAATIGAAALIRRWAARHNYNHDQVVFAQSIMALKRLLEKGGWCLGDMRSWRPVAHHTHFVVTTGDYVVEFAIPYPYHKLELTGVKPPGAKMVPFHELPPEVFGELRQELQYWDGCRDSLLPLLDKYVPAAVPAPAI